MARYEADVRLCHRRRTPRETPHVTIQPNLATPDTEAFDPGPSVAKLDTIVSLAKRRGFVYPSSEIYGGINAVWDYGPLGVELKNNVKRAWWRSMVQERDDIVGLDAGILMHPQVWVTSGHVGSFSDPLVECDSCHRRFRLDELPGAEDLSATELKDEGIVEKLGLECPVDQGQLSPPRRFNLMFKTHMGPVEDEGAVIYLRPETAQGSYVNFKNVQVSSRKKVPFGIAQIGKSFRNEISPGNFVFRMREFEQMEMQYFVRPGEPATAAFDEWLPARKSWYERYGVTPERLRFREHAPDELAHYAKKAIDVEYRFPFGWKELEGVHNRGDFDLGSHAKASGENLEYFDPKAEEHFIPWVVEAAAGADRAAFTFLIDSYREEQLEKGTRVVLKLHPDIAPYKVAVLPLLKKRPEIVELCHRIKADLQKDLMAVYDDTAAIGKLYRRQDEIGTPWCVTVDVDSLDDGAVTVRDRDSMAQERVPVENVKRLILDRMTQAREG
jgi:glycyl-tRNA synthetase